MTKYLDYAGLQVYDDLMKDYIEESSGGGGLPGWELVKSGTFANGYNSCTSLGLPSGTPNEMYRIITGTTISVCGAASLADSNFKCLVYKPTTSAPTALTPTSGYYGPMGESYKAFQEHISGDLIISYSRTWETIVHLSGWSYYGSHFQTYFYDMQVTDPAGNSTPIVGINASNAGNYQLYKYVGV